MNQGERTEHVLEVCLSGRANTRICVSDIKDWLSDIINFRSNRVANKYFIGGYGWSWASSRVEKSEECVTKS